jgi:hypothetical protein
MPFHPSHSRITGETTSSEFGNRKRLNNNELEYSLD